MKLLAIGASLAKPAIMIVSKGIFKHDRPSLLIERAGGGQLGNCYYGMSYRVTSTVPLCGKDLRALRDMGFLGHGQEFYYHQVIGDRDRLEVPMEHVVKNYVKQATPSGHDEVPCVDVHSDGTTTPALNYRKESIPSTRIAYYTYSVESRVDSSD